MRHDALKYAHDILSAAEDIEQFTKGLSFTEYQNNRLVKAAVERKFEIIGEAVNRLSHESPDLIAKVNEHEKIIAFRNLVIHGYDIVSDPIVWDVINNKLPQLVLDVTNLLADQE